MKALLLAAGEGKRLRPLTEKLPKPMISIGDKPILEHNINFLSGWGIREIAINLHHCPKAVMEHFGDGSEFGVRIIYSYEAELLGTAGAVKKLEHFFEDTFLVFYGDNLVKCDIAHLLIFHRAHQGIGTIVLHHRDDVSQSGVAILDQFDRVTQFMEKPQEVRVRSHWVNAGVLVLETDVLRYIPSDMPSDFGRDVLPSLLGQGKRLYGYRLRVGEHIWWIDRLEDLNLVRNSFNNGGEK